MNGAFDDAPRSPPRRPPLLGQCLVRRAVKRRFARQPWLKRSRASVGSRYFVYLVYLMYRPSTVHLFRLGLPLHEHQAI